MGRDAKSLELHRLAGTRPESREPELVSAPVAPGRPVYPRGLSRAAKAVFKRLCQDLETRKVLTPGDREALALFATIYDRHQRALADLATRGEIIEYDFVMRDGTKVTRTKPNEYLNIATACEKNLFAILQSLGLTPVSRSKVKLPKVDGPKELDEFEKLMLRRPRQFSAPGEEDAN